MGLKRVIRPRLNSDANALALTLLWEPHSFLDAIWAMTWESIVQIPDEIVFVALGKTEERASHHDELNFVSVVA